MLRLIKHSPPASPYQKKLVIEATQNTPAALETASLLNEVFNTDATVNKKITGTYLRKKVFDKCNRALTWAVKYFDEELPKPMRDEALERLKCFLEKHQEFSAFIRWMIIDDEKLNEALASFID